MRTVTLAAFALLLPGVLVAESAFDAAPYLALVDQTDASLKDFRRVKGTAQTEAGKVALTGWFDGSDIRKIVVRPGFSGRGFDAIYFKNRVPRFVFSKADRTEERLYLRDGEILVWISDPGFVPHGDDFASTSARLQTDVAAYLAALEPKAENVLAGTFVGIEQGDYAHWKMRTANGRERSFFVLQTNPSLDRVLNDPQEYEGRHCRVRWTRATENLESVGGPVTLEKILSVEWTE